MNDGVVPVVTKHGDAEVGGSASHALHAGMVVCNWCNMYFPASQKDCGAHKGPRIALLWRLPMNVTSRAACLPDRPFQLVRDRNGEGRCCSVSMFRAVCGLRTFDPRREVSGVGAGRIRCSCESGPCRIPPEAPLRQRSRGAIYVTGHAMRVRSWATGCCPSVFKVEIACAPANLCRHILRTGKYLPP